MKSEMMGLPGDAVCSRWPSWGSLVILYISSAGSVSWSVADSCRVVIFFIEFSSKTSPLLVVMTGGDLSSSENIRKSDLKWDHF